MKNIQEKLKKNPLALIGIVVGVGGGFLYWFSVGCSSGSCPITSSPYLSMLWGGLMGFSVANLFDRPKRG